MTSKVYPHNEEAEITVLGSVIFDNSSFNKIEGYLQKDDFYNKNNKIVFDNMSEMLNNELLVDLVTLADYMDKNGSLGTIGGSPYLMDLIESAPTAIAIIHHADIVKDKSNQRKVIMHMQNIINQWETIKPLKLFTGFENLMAEISEGRREKEIFYPEELKEEIKEIIEEGGILSGLSMPWENLSRLARLRKGLFSVVTGSPGSGKSTVVDNIILYMADSHNWNTVIFSPENNPLELHLSGLIEKYIGIPVSGDNIGQVDTGAIKIAMDFINEHIVFLQTRKTPEIEHLFSLVKTIMKKKKVDCMVIDPYNMINNPRDPRVNETESINKFLVKIKNFCWKYDIHILIVAHPRKLLKKKDGNYEPAVAYDISGCHDDKTEVLTKNGWKKHADVTLKDRVACFDANTNKLIYYNPTKVWESDYNGEMYNYKSPSFDALVTHNHMMIVKPSWRGSNPPVTKESWKCKYSLNGWTRIPANEVRSGLLMPWATELSHDPTIPKIESIIGYDKHNLMRFLGWWIGEGWIHPKSKDVGICQSVGELQEEMEAVMKDMSIDYSCSILPLGTKGSKNIWRAYIKYKTNKKLCSWISWHCGYNSAIRKLPQMVWELDIKSKRILLFSLIDGDGRVKRNDTYDYATVSHTLANEVQRLSIECGRMASIRIEKPQKITHRTRFVVNVGSSDRHHISLRNSRHLKKRHYKGKVYCLTVPTGAYLVRRNGKPGIYGNSAHWFNQADYIFSVWRDLVEKDQPVKIFVQKVRYRHLGNTGCAKLMFNHSSGRYEDYHQQEEYPIY
jgi:replicative DNA helicase